ncbi:MAG: DUF2834 domain-containing protein [Blastocatellia bacterium]
MPISRKYLCVLYALIGGLAFAGTWGNVTGLVRQHGFLRGTLKFWQDVLVNESSRFITIDILFLGLAVIVWMILEARRLRIPGIWFYVVFGLLIAISLAVPLFLIHRERTLAALDPDAPAGVAHKADIAGVLLLLLAFTAFAVVALRL